MKENNTAPELSVQTDFTYADPKHNASARRWWVLTRTPEPYNAGRAASGPWPDRIAGWEDLTRQFGVEGGPFPFDLAFLTEAEVARWTKDVVAGLTPEVEARWERYLTHTYTTSDDRFPVAVVEYVVASDYGSPRHDHRLVYDSDLVVDVEDQIHVEMGADPHDSVPWVEEVSTSVVHLLPEGVEVGSEEHQARYRDWVQSRF